LGTAILDTIEDPERFRPREWALGHMTCERATAVLEAHLRSAAERAREPWSEGLVLRSGALDAQQYWDPGDRDRFAADYEFLKSTVLPDAFTANARSKEP